MTDFFLEVERVTLSGPAGVPPDAESLARDAGVALEVLLERGGGLAPLLGRAEPAGPGAAREVFHAGHGGEDLAGQIASALYRALVDARDV